MRYLAPWTLIMVAGERAETSPKDMSKSQPMAPDPAIAVELEAELASSRATNPHARPWRVAVATLVVLFGVFLALYWREASAAVVGLRGERGRDHKLLHLILPSHPGPLRRA